MSGDFAAPPGPAGQPQNGAHGHSGTTADAPGAGNPRPILRSGRGVAVAAWVAIGAGLALLIGISWSAALAWSDRDLQTADVGETGDFHALQVAPGMCLDEVGEDGSVADATVVACDEPHRAEVFTSVIFSVAKFPGTDDMRDQTIEQCGDRIGGLLPEDATWVAWAPSESSWARGDRVALCIAVFDTDIDEPLSPAGIKAAEENEPTDDGQDA